MSREMLANCTSDFHTLLCGVESSKMFQIHICEDNDMTSWMLCVLREIADVSRLPSMFPSSEPSNHHLELTKVPLRHRSLGGESQNPALASSTWSIYHSSCITVEAQLYNFTPEFFFQGPFTGKLCLFYHRLGSMGLSKSPQW